MCNFCTIFCTVLAGVAQLRVVQKPKKTGICYRFYVGLDENATFSRFCTTRAQQGCHGLKARGHGRIRGCLETVSWTRILQNCPCGHLHAIMRACMRSGAGTGDCAPTLARRAHVWSPASFMHKHSMNGALLGIIWYWNMIVWTHARHTHGARTCT